MFATICMLTALLPGQSSDRSEALLVPRLNRGQELFYRGTYTEEALGRGVQYTRAYRLEGRVFVLESPARGFDVTFLTVLKHAADPSSVRLELAHVTSQGRVVPEGDVSLQLPLDGPPTLECGAFVEGPRGRVNQGQTWEVTDPGRPALTWRLVGSEVLGGTSCLKLVGRQQSEDWDQPRADRTAWKREETVWIAARTGTAQRVERTIWRREPARREPTQRLQVQYDLDSSMQFPQQLFEERRREVQQARGFAAAAAPLLPNPAKHSPRAFEALLSKIANHLETQTATPYRDAVLHVKRQLEAARRGETPLVQGQENAASVVTVGYRAPDFMTANMLTRESVRLNHFLGKPVLLIFYSPHSQTVDEVLRFGQSIQNAQKQTANVVGLVLSDDLEKIQKQHGGLNLAFPVLSGRALRQTYGVDATPKFIVLDAGGVVRASFTGWGPEAPTGVKEELRTLIQQGSRKESGKTPQPSETLTSRPAEKP